MAFAERLLRLEAGGGDPFSVINLYLAEQAEKERADKAPRPLQPKDHAAAPAGPKQQARLAGRAAAPAAPSTAPEEARPNSSASDRENVSANVGSRRAGRAPVAALGSPAPLEEHGMPRALSGQAEAGGGPLLEQAFQVGWN